MALLAANLEAKQGRTDNARKMYAVAAAHALSTIALQVWHTSSESSQSSHMHILSCCLHKAGCFEDGHKLMHQLH